MATTIKGQKITKQNLHSFVGSNGDFCTATKANGLICDRPADDTIHQVFFREVTEVERFVQAHSDARPGEFTLVRFFTPGEDPAADNRIRWHMMDGDHWEFATIWTTPLGEITRFEFNYGPGDGPNVIPFLIATIDWLVDSRQSDAPKN